ncbi:MAG: tRNA (N(6)-L-threonylcarbamoyladenosine(37)-C(2))-methylthiotransferase MtaB [Candidatus Firestonebacteria bacterium]
MKTAVIDTLGCKVNQYESQAMRELLESNGFLITNNIKKADFYIINTCIVTHTAERDSYLKINKAIRDNPFITVVVTGCLANENKNIKGAQFILENESKGKILQVIGKSGESRESKESEGNFGLKISDFYGHTRAFVKIQDGCENFCSYCKVPYVRGKIKSRNLNDLVDEVKRLTKKGYKEIVLTGINLGSYGKDLDNEIRLLEVLKALIDIKDIGRIRLSSIELKYISRELIDLISTTSKICNHLHIPLQSGDDEILKKMKRNYLIKDYKEIASYARDKIKDISITTDVIVGFPGEDDKNFNNTCKVIEEIQFLKVHIFTYSDRIGTDAYNFFNKVNDDIKNKRHLEAQEICSLNSKEIIKSFMGKELEVLVESTKDKISGLFKGISSNYIKMSLENADESLINKIVKVKLLKVDDFNLGMVIV